MWSVCSTRLQETGRLNINTQFLKWVIREEQFCLQLQSKRNGRLTSNSLDITLLRSYTLLIFEFEGQLINFLLDFKAWQDTKPLMSTG